MFIGKKNKDLNQLRKQIKTLEKEIIELKNKNTESKHSLFIIEKLFEISKLGYWIISQSNQVVKLSENAKAIFGVKGKNIISYKEFLEYIHQEDIPMIEKAINNAGLNDKVINLEFRVLYSENEEKAIKICSSELIRIKLDDNEYITGLIIDNTAQEKMKKDLSKAIEKVYESERHRNILLTNVTNEIRTPMNAIIGFAELLNIGNLDYEKRKEYVNTIKNQGTHILKFIDDITELIKLETGELKFAKTRCNLNILLKEIEIHANHQKKLFNKDILEIRLQLPDNNDLIIQTDPGRLQQVILNLINNSIKFTEKGFIEFGYKMPVDNKIEFYVKDTGIGLSKEQQKNIFNRFADEESVTRKYEGSGLGLTLSRYIVKMLGGKIWVESEPGKGSVFQFILPFEKISYENHDYSTIEEEQMPVYKWKDKVIIIVEDDEINFKFLEAILQDTDTQIIHANNGAQAVELCKSINKIDLILMDIKMPEMDGIEATKQIRQFNSRIPIIAHTAFSLQFDLKKCINAGCNDWIVKPIDIREFLEKLNHYLKE
jgi:signal transduction histidine kinase